MAFSFTTPSRTRRTKAGYRPSVSGQATLGSVSGRGMTYGEAVTPDKMEPPAFEPIEFSTIDPANYNYTDPIKYAQQIGAVNKGQIQQNWSQAKGMALEALDTELAGMRNYTAASSAIKRGQIALDNPFNQEQRIKQLNSVMPEVAGDLAAQRSRANAYASGRLPDSALDRALELGVRSSAADSSTFAGFGAKSLQASKISDLMSADQRFQISQYGEGLLGQNIQTKAALELAPTEYSQAGSEIKVMPEVGAGRLSYQGLGTLNEATMITPAAALSSKVGQEQFKTQIEQRTNEFNATGQYDASKFNATGSYTAALNAFGYDVAYEDAMVAANQSQLNTAMDLQLMGIQGQGGAAGVSAGQNAQTTQGITESIGAINGALNTASGMFTPSNTETTAPVAERAKLTSEPLTTGGVNAAPVNSGVDASIPTAIKFAGGMDVPAGYTKVASNSDGSYSAVPTAEYTNELAQFAAMNKVPMESLSIENMAIADRNIANATGLSYQPLPSFQPIGTLTSGRQVYSLPAAANGMDANKGAANVSNVGALLASLGVQGDEVYSSLGELAALSSDPGLHAVLDETYASEGPSAVAAVIRDKMLRGASLDTAQGQQGAFMAQRLGELWSGLSPEQKATGLAALTGPAMQLKTGRDVNNEFVPGTESAAAGGLRVGDAISLTTEGKNGIGLARNWSQLSSLVGMATGAKNPRQVADVAQSIGALGFGPQGASVPVPPKYLAKVGARPAPEIGVGAAVFDKPSHVPKHYKIITQTPDGGTLAMPANMMSTATLGAGGPAPIAFNKSKDISLGRHPATHLWEQGSSGAIRGSAGGSALVSSLSKLVNNNPDMAGAVLAHSLFNNVMGADNG